MTASAPDDEHAAGVAGGADWGGAALAGLAAASGRLHPDDLAVAVAREAGKLGLEDLAIYLVDLEQRVLTALPGPGLPAREPLGVDSTVAGRAFRTERSVVIGPGDVDQGGDPALTRIWIPLLDSAERLGVVGATAKSPDARLIQQSEAFVALVGELVANKAHYGDLITTTRRTREVTMAAELRWAMLPPLTYTGRNMSISGILEPAYEIAGDTFDYSVNGDTAHVAIIDAVGHGLEAARIANLAVLAYRHSRRRGLDTVATYRAMDEVVSTEFGEEKFATAQLATFDTATGQLRWLNAGHPAPMVIRQTHRIDLPSEVSLPVGLGRGDAHVAEAVLEPGDHVLFFSDGVTEARSTDGEQFGRARLADLLGRAVLAAQTPAETMRRLAQAVLDHQQGVLQDDATLLVAVWEGLPVRNF